MSVLAVIAFGLLVGFLLGALGAGGSVVTVPILVYALRENVQTAAVTSLLIVATTAAVGAASHFRAGSPPAPSPRHPRWSVQPLALPMIAKSWGAPRRSPPRLRVDRRERGMP